MRDLGYSMTVIALSLYSALVVARAESVTLVPVADTSLVETAPDNNLGAQGFLVAGVIDRGGVPQRMRGLVRFDLSQIPANAVVSSATLTLSVVVPNPDLIGELLYLRRLLQPWSEGAQSGGTELAGPLGASATEGESDWNHRLHPGVDWGAPGAGGPIDIANGISGIGFIRSVAEYPFASGQLTSDVQRWVTNPATNHGWMLIAGVETSVAGGAARQFGSREDSLHAPRLTVNYSVPKPVITTSSPLPNGIADSPYHQVFAAAGSMAPYTWSLSSGALPDGIHLGGDGVLNGTPTESGSFSFAVRVADPVHAASTKDFVLTIQPAPLGIDTAPLPVGRVHVPYQSTLHASGGTPPYTWTLYSGPRHLGKLPTGFELSGGGVVSGQPTEALQASFEVQVTDGLGATATASFNLLIEAIDPYLTQEAIVDGLFSFLMTVEARATNIVQFRDQLGSGDWGTLTNVTAPTRTTVTISDPATRASRFYRFYSTNAPGPPR